MKREYDYGMKGLMIAMLAAVMLGACATALAPADASAEVRALAHARWDALVRGDVSVAYGYLSPASRASLSLLQYQQRIHVGFWKRAVVESVSCEPEVCKVGVNITYDYKMAKGVEAYLSESWVKEDGKWWFVLKK